jgi:hypothetical protein
MQDDGQLVLYDASWKAVWSTATWGNAGVQLVLRNDGTLALTNTVATVVLNQVGPQLVVAPTVTAGMTPGTATITWPAAWDAGSQTLSYAIYRDSATTPIYTTSLASTVWQKPVLSYTDPQVPAGTHTYYLVVSDAAGNQVRVSTVLAAGVVTSQATLANGSQLEAGEGLVSPNGSYLASIDATGALSVTTSAGMAVWKSPAAGAGAHLVMQSDGNLVLYSAGWTAVWSTATWNNPNDELTLRNDGTLAVLSATATVLWVS